MSQPQIAPEPVEHLTFPPAPSTSPFKLPALLEFLSARIAPTLGELRTHDLSPPPFLTLVVGSPAHLLAGKALHSHLVGCYTNNDTRYHFTLFVPVGPDHCLPVPLEWAPFFVTLATICLFLPMLHTFMKVLRRSTLALFFNYSASLPSKTWASLKRTSTPLKTV